MNAQRNLRDHQAAVSSGVVEFADKRQMPDYLYEKIGSAMEVLEKELLK